MNNLSHLPYNHNSSAISKVCENRKVGKKTLGVGALVLAAQLLMTPANAMLPTPEAAQDLSLRNAAAPTSAAATQASPISSQVTAYIVGKNDAGAEQLTPVTANTQITRGSVIEYRTKVTNNNSDRVRDMLVSVAVPPQMTVTGNITPRIDSASLDGSSFHRTPIRGRIEGKVQEVPTSYYKALRWKIEGLGINESQNLVYRATVR